MRPSIFNRATPSHHTQGSSPYRPVYSDEVDDNEKPELDVPSQHAPMFRPWIYILGGTILGSACVIILAAMASALHLPKKLDREWIVPDLPSRTVVFEADPLFGEPPTPENDAAWDGLMPDGRGFVLIPDAEKYGFPRGIPTESGVDRYCISMFHQLHCLAVIRQAYYANLRNESHHAYNEEALSGQELVHHQQLHASHCFDYLRQGIMCAGDMSIEFASSTIDLGHPTVDGWNIPHTCKNFDVAKNFVQKHHAPHNFSGII